MSLLKTALLGIMQHNSCCVHSKSAWHDEARQADLFEDKEHELAEDCTAGNLHSFVHLLLAVAIVACQPVSLQNAGQLNKL